VAVYRGFDDGYIDVTEDMMTPYEKLALSAIRHLGTVVVQRTIEKGTFTFDYRCMIDGKAPARYGDSTLVVLQMTRDVIYNRLLGDCGFS